MHEYHTLEWEETEPYSLMRRKSSDLAYLLKFAESHGIKNFTIYQTRPRVVMVNGKLHEFNN